MHVAPSRVGQVLAGGRYRVVRQIGRGSFGDVYLAENLGGGPERPAQLVLKILHPQWAQVDQVVQRFRRESVITSKVEHPHIARVFEHGQLDDASPYIAMEYLPGQSLREAMKSGAMELGRAVPILGSICEALAAAHRAGVVHRDLKPENIQLVTRGGNAEHPVVLDFGVAKFLDAAERLTMTGAVLGTPVYMAPEQYRGEQDLGPAADVYALAVLIFEVLAGRPPFVGRNFAELAVAHTTQPPPPLAGVPPPLANLINRCLAKEPGGRPPVNEMVKVLRGLSLLGARAAPPRAPIPETLVVNAAEQATLVSNGPPVFLPPPPTPPVAADNNQTVISPPDLPKRPPTEPSLIVDQRPDPRRQWMLVSALGLLIAVVGLALILLFK